MSYVQAYTGVNPTHTFFADPSSKNLEERAIAEAIYARCVSHCVDALVEDPSTHLLFGFTIQYPCSILDLSLQNYVYSQGFPLSCILEAPIELEQIRIRIETAFSAPLQKTVNVELDEEEMPPLLDTETAALMGSSEKKST